MASDNLGPSSRNFDRWLRVELRSWASRQDLSHSLRAALMLRVRELHRPQVNASQKARPSNVGVGVGGVRSLDFAQLVEPTLEFGFLSLRWVS